MGALSSTTDGTLFLVIFCARGPGQNAVSLTRRIAHSACVSDKKGETGMNQKLLILAAVVVGLAWLSQPSPANACFGGRDRCAPVCVVSCCVPVCPVPCCEPVTCCEPAPCCDPCCPPRCGLLKRLERCDPCCDPCGVKCRRARCCW